MNLESILILNSFSIAFLIVICIHAMQFLEKNSLSDKLYIAVLYVTMFMLVVDSLARFDGVASPVYPVFNEVGNLLSFMLNPLLPSLWVIYVHFQIFRDERKIKRLSCILLAVNIINIVVIGVSRPYGLFYDIDQDNIYRRGPLFGLAALLTALLMLISFYIIIRNRKKLDKKSFNSLMFFGLPPSVGILIQYVYYGTSMVLNAVVLSLLVVFLNIQHHSLHTDYLTGVSNRKRLDSYLSEKINTCTKEKTFSAILIDINNFKCINDTYGHAVGDQALEATAKLLKSCLRNSDFIARYGGDEFCIILDTSNREDLESVIERINECLEKYNKTASHTYKLSFSMGYAVYDNLSWQSPEEFMKKLDMLMYEDKQANRIKCDDFLQLR
jgi:diguanylate cyclase (GGDEF)-like protein